MVREFDEIFSDLFSRKNASHKEIVACLANGPKDLGPFFQNPTAKQAGCQIDYLVQTRFHNLDLFEVKFSSCVLC